MINVLASYKYFSLNQWNWSKHLTVSLCVIMIMCLYMCVWLGHSDTCITCGLLPLCSVCSQHSSALRPSFTGGQLIHRALDWNLLNPSVDQSLHCLIISTGWPCSSPHLATDLSTHFDCRSKICPLVSRHAKTFVNTRISFCLMQVMRCSSKR